MEGTLQHEGDDEKRHQDMMVADKGNARRRMGGPVSRVGAPESRRHTGGGSTHNRLQPSENFWPDRVLRERLVRPVVVVAMICSGEPKPRMMVVSRSLQFPRGDLLCHVGPSTPVKRLLVTSRTLLLIYCRWIKASTSIMVEMLHIIESSSWAGF